ncbi:DUF2147 domain-containing protein [Lentimicrobium sp. S6]|uniref:DUF2147 domain-containing protein n=1 Tax=Lentimicrobium sp. S6 TaxID=2735872 RepID=UPI001553749E|nr:DUF2147 domain-containing protein [Lentimicrobium sp. S6]NPD47956.1 DUF2147 domain-containing protein [Lentimicrobium sp. S6]
MKNLKSVLTVVLIGLISLKGMAQNDVKGKWAVGEQNNVIEIIQIDGVYSGKLISSDNPKAKIGMATVKDLKQNKKGKLEGKVYSAKREKWYDAEFTRKDNKLIVEISIGFFSKTIEWVAL